MAGKDFGWQLHCRKAGTYFVAPLSVLPHVVRDLEGKQLAFGVGALEFEVAAPTFVTVQPLEVPHEAAPEPAGGPLPS